MRRALLTVLAFAGVTGILMGLLNVVPLRTIAVSSVLECPVGSAGDAHRTTRLTIDNSDVSVPQLTSITIVTVSRRSTLSSSLLLSPRFADYQQAMRCLLRPGDAEPDWRWSERRRTTPLVETKADSVVVTDTTYTDIEALGIEEPDEHQRVEPCRIPGMPSETRPNEIADCTPDELFGPWEFRRADTEHWYFALKADAGVPWHEVTVNFPKGWLSIPTPLPQTSGQESVTWRPTPTEAVTFAVMPDLDARGAAMMNQHPARAIRDVLVDGWDLVVLGLALLCSRAIKAYQGKRRRFFVVPFVLVIFSVLSGLAYEGLGPPSVEGDDEFVYWLVGTSTLLLAAGLVLWAGRLRFWVTAAAMVAVFGAYVSVGAAEHYTHQFPESLPGLPWTTAVTIAASLLLMNLLMGALLNGIRLAWQPNGAAKKIHVPWWVWGVAGTVAVTTVSYSCFASARDRSWAGWLATDPRLFGAVTFDLLWLPYNVLTWLGGGLLWIWPLTVLVAHLRRHAKARVTWGEGPLWQSSPGATPDEVRRARSRRMIILWIFAVNAFGWSEFYGGFWIPVKVMVGALALWVILRWSRTRMVAFRRLRNRQTGRDARLIFGTLGPGQEASLREAARHFLIARRAGRLTDAAAGLSGDLMKKEDAQKLADELDDLRRWPPNEKELELPEDVSPLHLALLVGPEPTRVGGTSWRTSPLTDLAWRTGILTMFMGLAPTCYLLWRNIVNAGGLAALDTLAGFVYPAYVLWDLLFWFVPGYLLGLLWRELPGRTGPIKALPLAGAYSVATAVRLMLVEVFDLGEVNDTLLRAILLFAVLTTAGLVIDIRTLRQVLAPWSRIGRFLMDVYRLESIPSQATFMLAQLAAILAIIQFVRGQGGEPQYPSIDPFQMPRAPG